jgi:hypothetical protein
MIENDLEKLRLSVLSRQQILNFIYSKYKNQTLVEYVKSWQTAGAVKKSTLDILKHELLKIYEEDLVLKVCQQIGKIPLISTVDHHGILGHPFFLNANLIFAQNQNLKFLPVFSTSGVSLNNSSWPGCLHLTNWQTGKQVRISFFPDSQKHLPVFSTPAFLTENVNKVIKQISEVNFLDLSQKEKLTKLIEKVFLDKRVLEAENFSEQSSLVSVGLWQEVFPSAPKLVYLPIEDLVLRIIEKEYLTNTESVIYKLIFTEAGHKLLEKYFYGLKGGFGKNYGSFLFWGIGENKERVALKKNDMSLQGDGFDLEINKTQVLEAISNRQIYPTSLLCFLVSLESGLNCLGGFNQVNWLTEIKKQFGKLLLELGDETIFQEIDKIVTENFTEGNLAFILKNNKIMKTTLLDAYLEGENSYEKFSKLASTVTVGESIDSLLPEMYRIVVPLEERENNLLKVSDLDIISLGLMKKKIEQIFN